MLLSDHMTEQSTEKYDKAIKSAESTLRLRIGFSARTLIGRIVASPSEETTFRAIIDARRKLPLWGNRSLQIVDGVEPVTNSQGNQRRLLVRLCDGQYWLHSTPTAPTHR
jgi:uncharacterized protein (DUF2342 family)